MKHPVFWLAHRVKSVRYGVLLVLVFPYSVRILENTKYSPNTSGRQLMNSVKSICSSTWLWPTIQKQSSNHVSNFCNIWDAFCDLIPFVQFKKLEKHPCWSVFSHLCTNGNKSRKASHIKKTERFSLSLFE